MQMLFKSFFLSGEFKIEIKNVLILSIWVVVISNICQLKRFGVIDLLTEKVITRHSYDK